MTRALIITPSFPGPESPVAGNFVRDQVVALSELGIESVVVQFRSGFGGLRWARRSYWQYRVAVARWSIERRANRRRGVAPAETFPVHRVLFAPVESDDDVIPAVARALVTLIKSLPGTFDVIYAHWVWPAGAAALLVRDALGIPLVTIARGCDLTDWLAKPGAEVRALDVLRGSDRLLANCQYLRRRADELVAGAGVRCEVVYNGVDSGLVSPSPDRQAVRNRLGIASSERVLLCCAHIDVRKGHRELAAAWQQIERSFPSWRLVLVGRVVDQTLGRLVASGPRTVLTGEVSHDEVIRWMQSADLYVQPSRWEGMANATLEALAAGLAVVTTDTSGQPELVEPDVNGRLVATNNPDDLATALAALMGDDSLRAAMGDAGRTKAVTVFDRGTQVRRLAEILTDTAAAATG